jgi:hypothetical protein
MRSPLPNFQLCVVIAVSIILFGSVGSAQEKSKSPSGETPNSKSQFPAAKKVIPPVESANVADDLTRLERPNPTKIVPTKSANAMNGFTSSAVL